MLDTLLIRSRAVPPEQPRRRGATSVGSGQDRFGVLRAVLAAVPCGCCAAEDCSPQRATHRPTPARSTSRALSTANRASRGPPEPEPFDGAQESLWEVWW